MNIISVIWKHGILKLEQMNMKHEKSGPGDELLSRMLEEYKLKWEWKKVATNMHMQVSANYKWKFKNNGWSILRKNYLYICSILWKLHI